MNRTVLHDRLYTIGATSFLNAEEAYVDDKQPGRKDVATNNDIANKIEAFFWSHRRVLISDIVLFSEFHVFQFTKWTKLLFFNFNFFFNFFDSKQ